MQRDDDQHDHRLPSDKETNVVELAKHHKWRARGPAEPAFSPGETERMLEWLRRRRQPPPEQP